MFVYLPESGADPTIESDSGFNAMDMAVAMGHRNGMCELNKTPPKKKHLGRGWGTDVRLMWTVISHYIHL